MANYPDPYSLQGDAQRPSMPNIANDDYTILPDASGQIIYPPTNINNPNYNNNIGNNYYNNNSNNNYNNVYNGQQNTNYNNNGNNNINNNVYYQNQNNSQQDNSGYNYNPYNIQYQEMSIEQWQQIPCQESEYSQFWGTPDSYAPDKFSENTKIETHYNDVCWMVIFWINFVATVGFLIYLIVDEGFGYVYFAGNTNVTAFKDIGICIGIGLAIGLGVSIIHFLMILCCSECYLTCGLVIGLIYAILSAVFFTFFGGVYYAFIFPVLYLILMVLFYCSCCKYIPFSARILKMSAKILMKYPGIICFCVFQVIWNIIVEIVFVLLIYLIQKKGISYYVYIYVILSYLWCTLTFQYVEYLTIAGVASSWYFLNDTEYFPNSPVLKSFQRAMSTSFGSAAVAGLLLAVIQFLRMLVEMSFYSDSDSGDSGVLQCIFCLLRCIALCILSLLEACVSYLNRFALIYCATFGIPYIAACKRWMELECTRFVNLIMNSCVISNATTYNMFAFVVSTALIGYGVGYAMYKEDFLLQIFMCIFAAIFTFGIYDVLIEPIVTIGDTLLVCFSESPEQLKTSAFELYEMLAEYYGKKLMKRLTNHKSDSSSG